MTEVLFAFRMGYDIVDRHKCFRVDTRWNSHNQCHSLQVQDSEKALLLRGKHYAALLCHHHPIHDWTLLSLQCKRYKFQIYNDNYPNKCYHRRCLKLASNFRRTSGEGDDGLDGTVGSVVFSSHVERNHSKVRPDPLNRWLTYHTFN